MPRRYRVDQGGYVYHVMNRANARVGIFETDLDYQAFEDVLFDACRRRSMRLLSYCVMPNHWHLVLWPVNSGDLAVFMHWLTLTHVRRWHMFHQTAGTGHLYQGRFKSFPIEMDDHFLRVARYVEQNALRAGLVKRAEAWRWSSLWQRGRRDASGNAVLLDRWPVERPPHWIELVNERLAPEVEKELARSIARGTPFGNANWREATARALGLESTLRPRGRPRKT